MENCRKLLFNYHQIHSLSEFSFSLAKMRMCRIVKQHFIKQIKSHGSVFLGAAEYHFTFVPHFTRFHGSNNAHVKI